MSISGPGVSSTLGAMHISPTQLGFPAELTSGWSTTRGYSWKRLVLDRGTMAANNPNMQVVGDLAVSVDGNTTLTAGMRGWMETYAGMTGYFFIPVVAGGGGGGVTRLASFFSDAANSGSAETNLYTFTVPAGTLAADGDMLVVEFFGTAASNATLRGYFAGATIFTQAIINVPWRYRLTLIREGNTTVRQMIQFSHGTAQAMNVGNVSSLTLASTAYVLKITGEGSISNLITAKGGYVEKHPA